MELREQFLRMVDYERHANGLWLKYLASVADRPNGCQLRAESDKWLFHIAGCYRSWFNWLDGRESDWTDDVEANLEIQYARMKDYIGRCDLDVMRSRSEEPHGTWQWATRDVIHHALTHGVYHRGHLRALAEAHGFDDWPDTDWDEFTGKAVS